VSIFYALVVLKPTGPESTDVIYYPVSRSALPRARLGPGDAFFLIQSSNLLFFSLCLTGLRFLNLFGELALSGDLPLSGDRPIDPLLLLSGVLPLTGEGEAFRFNQLLMSAFFCFSDLSLN
jgi:hypothetical protein